MGGGTISETHDGTHCFVTSDEAADGTVEGYDIEVDTGSGFVSSGVLAASGTVSAVPPYSIRRKATVADAVYSALKSPMGMNLWDMNYSSPEIPYADVLRQAAGYAIANGVGSLHQDSDGWLTSLDIGSEVQTGVFVGAGGRYPAGTYKATWLGTGTIVWYQDVLSYSSTGSHSADVVITTPTTNGIRYKITATDPADPIKNIALWLPGVTPNSPVVTKNATYATQFNPEFLAKLANYGALRFMDMFGTLGYQAFVGDLFTAPFVPSASPVWADRTRVTKMTFGDSDGGSHRMPYEHAIELCNQLGARPWLNIPPTAGISTGDTAFVDAFAAMVAANLYDDLCVYVERGNENWNFGFHTAHLFYRIGDARTPAVGGAEVSAEYSRSDGIQFKAALGDERVTSIFAWQSVGIAGLIAALDHNIALYGSHGFDAGATALYYGEGVGDATELAYYNGMSEADAVTAMYAAMATTAHTAAGFSLPTTQAYFEQWKETLTSYDIDVLLYYENGNSTIASGGVGPVGEDPQINSTMNAFSRDARIKDLTIDYLDGARNAGGELNMYFNNVFNYSRFGRWGTLERIDTARADAPVYDGIQTWMENNSADLVPDVIEERAHGGTIARLQVSTIGAYGTGPRTRIWQRKLSGGSFADLTDEDGLSHRSSGMTLGGTYVWRTKLTDRIGNFEYSNEVTIILEVAEIAPPTTGLIAHWKKGTGITSGGVGTGVSAWVDVVGSKSLAQATGAKQPLLQSDNSILFDGTDDYLQSALPALPATATFAIVGKQNSWIAGRALCDAGTTSQTFLMTQHTTSPRIDCYAGGTTPSLWTDDWVIGQEDVLIMTWNGASSNMRVSDGAVTVCTAGTPGTPSGAGLTLGAESGAGVVHFANIQVKDVLLYNAVLSAPDMAQLIRFGLLE